MIAIRAYAVITMVFYSYTNTICGLGKVLPEDLKFIKTKEIKRVKRFEDKRVKRFKEKELKRRYKKY